MIDLQIESKYHNKIIAGIDEAGRGALAGPVVAASVIVNKSHYIDGIQDSKKVSKKKRENLYNSITKHYHYSTGIISANEIDRINILQATIKACYASVCSLQHKPEVVIVDGNMKFSDIRFNSIIKGDAKSYSIAAASIIAKVTRDRLMEVIALKHTNYNWHQNFGYPTPYHINAIHRYGITDHHRKSFAPMKNILLCR